MRSDSSLFSSLFWWSSDTQTSSSRSLTPSEVKARKVALKCIQVSVALVTYTPPNLSSLSPPLSLHSFLPSPPVPSPPLPSPPLPSPPLPSPPLPSLLPTLLPSPQDCHPEQLFSESKFLCPEALQELTKALTDATRGSEGAAIPLDDDSAMFLMELLVTVAMENK